MTQPEQIRDPIAEAITDYFGERCADFMDGCQCCEVWSQYDQLSALRAQAPTAMQPEDELVVVAWEDGWGELTHAKPDTHPSALVRQSEAAAHISRLEADVARLTKERDDAEGINLLDGDGWVFWNPDSGEEYSDSDPAHSGECDDAERVRKSTAQEDVLWRAVQSEFTARLTAEAQNKAMRDLVEQAFRDGLAYGSNVSNGNEPGIASIAWAGSRARATLSTIKEGGGKPS